MPVTDSDVSALAKELMLKGDISARELARRMGKSHSRIDDRLSGRFSWKLAELFALTRALGVPIGWFTDELERRDTARSS